MNHQTKSERMPYFAVSRDIITWEGGCEVISHIWYGGRHWTESSLNGGPPRRLPSYDMYRMEPIRLRLIHAPLKLSLFEEDCRFLRQSVLMPQHDPSLKNEVRKDRTPSGDLKSAVSRTLPDASYKYNNRKDPKPE